MKASLLNRLYQLQQRHQEVGALLSEGHIIADQKQFRSLSSEYAQLDPIAAAVATYQQCCEAIKLTEEMAHDPDEAIQTMAKEELALLTAQQEAQERGLKLLLIPKDPNDDKNVFLEVRAGTGGDEAALFAGDIFRMYARFCEQQGWTLETLSAHESEQGGFKEIISRISGNQVYALLKFESGAHRVQRVPTTESQGRIHTSACTVAIMPEADALEQIDINPNDLRVDTFRASGAGGQHVNKTDSAIRITHLPSGLVVECQDERSQHKNRARAMSLLQTRLQQKQETEQQAQQAQARKQLVGSGDRSERIRTYNFPQGRVTDHRINLTLYQLEEVLAGKLNAIIEPLTQELQAMLLTEIND